VNSCHFVEVIPGVCCVCSRNALLCLCAARQ